MTYLMRRLPKVDFEADLVQVERFIELVPVPVTVLDGNGMSLLVNKAYCEVLGLRRETVKNRQMEHALHPDDVARAKAVIEQALVSGQSSDDLRLHHADGHYLSIHWDLLYDQQTDRLMAIASDRTTERARLAEAQHRASTDDLTGVLSRAGLMENLQATHREHPDSGLLIALFDVDGFKKLNDSLGHRAGDDILRVVSQRIRRALPPTATLGRLGGDEFVVLCPPGAAELAELGSRIASTFAEPLTVAGRKIQVSASIGLYESSKADSPDDLLHKADIAVYEAKRKGRNQQCIADDLLIDGHEMAEETERRLAASLGTGDFVPYFQPIVRPSDLRIDSYEVLMRWVDARGVVQPACSFLEVASKARLLPSMSTEVQSAAIASASRLPQVRLALNASPQELLEPHFVDRLQSEAEMYGVAPERLIIEVTEQTALLDLDRASGLLRRLRDLGFTVALDDFGSGYSSLTYLTKLPIDVVKLDGTFLQAAASDAEGMRLLGAVVDFLQKIDLAIVVEGVETQADHELIEGLGVQLGQGWFYGRPGPAELLVSDQVAQTLAARS